MIKASELRIGNLLNWDCDNLCAGEGYVSEIYEHGFRFVSNKGCHPNGDEYKEIKPIPITAEWLEKFGFDKITEGGDNFCDEYLKSPVLIHCDGEDFWFGFDAGPKLRRNFAITSLHQLQNLYFALTGEELKIKKTV